LPVVIGSLIPYCLSLDEEAKHFYGTYANGMPRVIQKQGTCIPAIEGGNPACDSNLGRTYPVKEGGFGVADLRGHYMYNYKPEVCPLSKRSLSLTLPSFG
jgi:hypothetical protein